MAPAAQGWRKKGKRQRRRRRAIVGRLRKRRSCSISMTYTDVSAAARAQRESHVSKRQERAGGPRGCGRRNRWDAKAGETYATSGALMFAAGSESVAANASANAPAAA